MNNVDALIFTKDFVTELEELGLFNPDLDVFLDKEALYDELLKVVTENLENGLEPYPTDDQFNRALVTAKNVIIMSTFDDLVDLGIFETKINKKGEILYDAKMAKELKEMVKKNILKN